jgi:DNA-binding transcriptional LysR family regulator
MSQKLFDGVEMPQTGLPTLDQLRVFIAVVDEGSFAGAGRALNRALSVVSYTITGLENQLGVSLFSREGKRRPQLTEAGRSVLADARSVSQGMDSLRAKVAGLLQGLEGEVNLAVDVMLPSARLGRVLRDFATRFPSVSLRLHVEALGAVTALVLDGRADLGISGPLSAGVADLESVSVGMVPMIPVAAPDHPLSGLQPIPAGEARKHVQLVLTDRSQFTEGRDFSVLSPKTWRLADLGAKHALLREGIGWGNMPLPVVAQELSSGVLVALEIPENSGGLYRFSGIWRRDTPPGPAASWLLEEFARLALEDRSEADLPDI